MSKFEDDSAFVPEHFCGRARLFPLPNLVLFPHVVQPLHVFENRYVDLLHEALEEDRLIAMALLNAGWEHDYEGRPPLAPMACLGRVLTWQAQPGPRYNLLLLGVRRVRLLRELEPRKTFREAEVQLIEDEYTVAASNSRPALHRRLVAAFEAMLPRIADAEELFNQLSLSSVSLGTLTDVISYALELPAERKQALLSEADVDVRAKMLLSHLKTAARDSGHENFAAAFPPTFSSN